MKTKNRKIIIAIGMLIISSLTSYAQSAGGAWKNLVANETEYYKFSVPASWKQMEMTAGKNPEQYFLPDESFLPITYNNTPVITTVWIAKMEAGNLKEAKEKIVKDYRMDPGREFAKGSSHEEEAFKLKSGEKAFLVNTRFYRKAKGLNQSRYDLVVYSPKAKSAYLYTMSVQYNDAEYAFEQKYKLKETAKNLYKNFQLKSARQSGASKRR